MEPESPTVSVIVVTWNGAELLPENLESLRNQVLGALTLEVIVVDNGSEDATLDLLHTDYPWVRVVALPANLGFAGGANAGIEASRGEVIVLLNNDASADPEFAAAAAAALSADPAIGAVTGLMLLADRYERATEGDLVAVDGAQWARSPGGKQLVNSTGGEVTRSANGRDRDWLVPLEQLTRAAGPVPGFSGGAVALRRAALDAVGTFDSRLFMYYEDSDLSWRLRRAGWRIGYEPAAVVRHRHAASSGTKSDFFLFHNERNRVLFALKHAPAAIVVAAVARTLGGAARALLRGDRRAAGRRFRALWSAARLSPGFLRDRRALDRAATVSRAAVWSGAPAD